MQLQTPYFILNRINRALFDRAVLPESDEISWNSIGLMAKKQSVCGLLWAGVQKSAPQPPHNVIMFLCKHESLERYQYAHQQRELKRVCDMLEAEKIPYVILKGSRMRKFYDDPALRTSCDVDILFDADETLLHQKMLDLGYSFTKDQGTTLNYYTEPVEFEMHRRLFDDRLEFQGLFERVWDYTVAREGSCERLLTEEFFYVYMVAHMAKHFTRYGCGVRPAIDLYLYNQKLPKNFDRAVAKTLLKQVDLLGFEQRVLALTKVWFETGNLTETDEMLTDYIMEAGIYGNNRISNAREVGDVEHAQAARRKKMTSYIFPPVKVMRRLYPRMMKCPLMLPVAWTARWCKIFSNKRSHGTKQLREYASVDEGYVSYVTQMTRELRLK